jgi:hypothetical protein
MAAAISTEVRTDGSPGAPERPTTLPPTSSAFEMRMPGPPRSPERIRTPRSLSEAVPPSTHSKTNAILTSMM